MEYISELTGSLNNHFGWNKSRITCFVKMLLAIFIVRTVNLTEIATAFASHSKLGSRYRRLQRFFSQFQLNYRAIAEFLFCSFFTQGEQLYLTLDRTNWKWGQSNINILMLGIAYKGVAIPIYWKLLDKRGNSDTRERIELMEKFTEHFGTACIAGLLADREFVGDIWFKYLIQKKIPFYIRVKNNIITTNARGQQVDIDGLFYSLKPGEQRILKGARKVFKTRAYLTGLRLDDGEMLIIASNVETEDPLKIYAMRWEIETLFSCLKGRGFRFEDTHITHQERLSKLTALLAIAFAWAHKTGEWRHVQKPLRLKKHGRLSKSFFRYGFEFIREALVQGKFYYKHLKQCLKLIIAPDLSNNEHSFSFMKA